LTRDHYRANIILPERWGKFLFVAVVIDQKGNVFHSRVVALSTWPSVEISSLPNETLRNSSIDISWNVQHADTVDSSQVFAAFSGDIWNDSLLSAGPFSGPQSSYTETISIPNATGMLRVGVTVRVDSRPEVFYSQVETIKVLDFFSITGTSLHYIGKFTQTVDISNISVSYSEPPWDSLGPLELSTHTYTITDAGGNDTDIVGNLSFNPITSVWGATGINVSYLAEGNYLVRLDFRYGNTNIPNLLSNETSFSINHTVSINDFNFTFGSNLSLIIENLTILSSNPTCSPLPPSCLMNSSLALLYDSNGTPVLNVRDIINFDPTSSSWASPYIDLAGAMPGIYRFRISIDTIFENRTVSGDKFVVEIPGLAGGVGLSVSSVSYADGPAPILEIGGIGIELPEQLNGGPYSDYLSSWVDFNLSSEAGYRETRTFYPLGFDDPGDIDFNLSRFPSGTYRLSGYFTAKVVFPLGGSLVLQADYIYPLPITVEHRYWFGDTVNVTVRQEKEPMEISAMDIGGLELFGTWDHDFEKITMVRATVMQEDAELITVALFYNELSGYWEIFDMDISTLAPGDYKISFEGEIGNLTFAGSRVLKNNSRFTIGSDGQEILSGSSVGLWVGIAVLSLIVLAAMAVLFHRIGYRKKKESSEDSLVEIDNEIISSPNNNNGEFEVQKKI